MRVQPSQIGMRHNDPGLPHLHKFITVLCRDYYRKIFIMNELGLKETVMDNQSNETGQVEQSAWQAEAIECDLQRKRAERAEAFIRQLQDALMPFALAFKESNSVGSIPDEQVWIWKPSDNRRETHGISRAHLKAAATILRNP